MCQSDADVSIATAAVELSQNGDTVFLWGDDTDLLILLLHHIEQSSLAGTIFMYRPSSDSCINVSKMASTMSTEMKQIILAIHAISGCDTVPALFGIGKTKLWKLLNKDPHLSLHSKVLKFYGNDPDEFKSAGVSIILALYDKVGSKQKDLESLRLW